MGWNCRSPFPVQGIEVEAIGMKIVEMTQPIIGVTKERHVIEAAKIQFNIKNHLFLIPQTVFLVGEVDVIAVIAIGVDGDTGALGVAITENIHKWCFRQKCIDLCQRGDIYGFKRWCCLHFFSLNGK